MMEELGVPYEIVRYQRQSNMLAPPELRAVHPLGKSPVITDKGNVDCEEASSQSGISSPKQWSAARAKVISEGFRDH